MVLDSGGCGSEVDLIVLVFDLVIDDGFWRVEEDVGDEGGGV